MYPRWMPLSALTPSQVLVQQYHHHHQQQQLQVLPLLACLPLLLLMLLLVVVHCLMDRHPRCCPRYRCRRCSLLLRASTCTRRRQYVQC